MFRLHPITAGIAAAWLAVAGAAAQDAPSTPAEGGQAQIGRVDREFMQNAAQAGRARMEASRLALSKSTDADLKGFAQRLIDDQTRANAQLRRIAQTKGVDVPSEASLAHKIKLQLLEFANGADFDQRYADDFGVEAHRETIELYAQAVEETRDPQVKAFARETLPKLQEQLETAQALRAGVQPGR